MPKLNITNLIERIGQRITDLEDGMSIEARDINVLLNEQQRNDLKEAWEAQQALRKLSKPPKTEEEKNQIGWKTIREVRLEVYKRALIEARTSTLQSLRDEQQKKEVRKAKVFLEGYFEANSKGKNALSAGNIAATRAGYGKKTAKSSRHEEMRQMEQTLKGNDTETKEDQ